MLAHFTRGLIAGLLITVFLIPASESVAERPQAPTILDFGPGGCLPTPEVCGDGIDQDCNGSDKVCDIAIGSGPDGDLDGVRTSLDCDDTNKMVYPGVSVSCDSSSCGTGWKSCQSNGSFSACSCEPLCEATGSGSCYYISKLSGNDANPGSFNAPWKSLAPIYQFRCYPGNATSCPGDFPPSGASSHTLQAGDVVYIMSGIYDEVWDFEGNKFGLHIRQRNGTASNPITIKAYPGTKPVIAPKTRARGIFLIQSSHIVLEGLEIARAYQDGIWIAEANNIELKNLRIHSTDGVDNDNIAGLTISHGEHIHLHHSLVHDNYDRTNADTNGQKTENSRNIVLFGGGNNEFSYNSIFQTPATNAQKTGACLVHKHAMTVPAATFNVHHNIFRNCFFAAVGNCAYGSRINNNLFIDSDESVSIRNHGGPSILLDNIAEYNTMVNTPGLRFTPSHAYIIGQPVGLMRFRHNVIADNHNYNTDVGGILRIDTYGSLAEMNWFLANADFQVQSNCYHNSTQTPSFAYYSNIPQGGLFSFSQWQSLGHDTSGSQIINPNLDQNFVAQNPACAAYGHIANW